MISEIVIQTILAAWFFTANEPIQNTLVYLFDLLPQNIITDTLYTIFSCPKCLAFFLTFLITFNIFSAILASLILAIITKILE